MKIALYAVGAAALAFTANPASAQDMQTQEQAEAAVEAKPVTDAELENFIIAASQMQRVSQNAEIAPAQKQQAMIQILSQAEMTPQRFNTIAMALESNGDLQARANQTVSRLQAEAQG